MPKATSRTINNASYSENSLLCDLKKVTNYLSRVGPEHICITKNFKLLSSFSKLS